MEGEHGGREKVGQGGATSDSSRQFLQEVHAIARLRGLAIFILSVRGRDLFIYITFVSDNLIACQQQLY